MRIKELTIILILALFGLASCKQHGSTDNWEKFFQENYVNGTFVLKNMNTNEPLIYNKERSNEEFVPASTFKILNSMIFMEMVQLFQKEYHFLYLIILTINYGKIMLI